MKTKIYPILVTAALAAANLGLAADAPKAACCADDKSACCADAKPAKATPELCCAELPPAAPLVARSIYRLDGKWTDDAGRTLTLASFRGRPVVLAMFFASCEYACPLLVNDMQRLRAALPKAVREKAQLVLVTFDTVRDTPPALKAYRERMTLDAGWTLLHSDASNVQELAMLLGVKFKQDARGQFAHSNLLTILNAEGEIAHQHAGLNGDVSEAAKAVVVAAAPGR